MNNHVTKKAFTLIEILIQLPIIALLLIIISAVFVSLIEVNIRIYNNLQAQQVSTQLLSTITDDIKWAESVAYSPPDLTINKNSSTIVYFYNGEKLFRRETTDSGETIDESLIPSKYKLNNFSVVQRSIYTRIPSYQVLFDLTYEYKGILNSINAEVTASVRNRYL